MYQRRPSPHLWDRTATIRTTRARARSSQEEACAHVPSPGCRPARSHSPSTVTIRPGGKVEWENKDSMNHTVTSGS